MTSDGIKGIIVPLVTPMHEDGSVNLDDRFRD